MAKASGGKKAAATPSRAGRELFYLKIGAWGSMLSGLAAAIAALIAVIVVLDRDLLLENIRLTGANADLHTKNEQILAQQVRLLSERISLAGENAVLRDARQALLTDKEKVSTELDAARAEQRRLAERAEALRQNVGQQTVRLARQQEALTQLGVARDELRAQSVSLSTTLEETAANLLRAGMMLHLASYEPNYIDLHEIPSYTYLAKTEDPAWRAGERVAWIFSAVEEDSLGQEDRRHSCRVQPGVRVVGFAIDFTTARISASYVDRDSPVLARVCAFLALRTIAYTGLPRKRFETTIYDLLRKGRVFVQINFFPGEIEGLKYEQWRTAGFWAPALGSVNRGKYLRMLDRENQGRLRGLFDNNVPIEFPAVINIEKTFAEMQQAIGTEALAPIRKKFVAMNGAWLKFLEGYTVEVGYRPQKLMEEGSFRTFLPRFGLAEIGSFVFMDSRDLVREFDYTMLCAAQEFAASEEYVGALGQEAAACKLRQDMIRAGNEIQ